MQGPNTWQGQEKYKQYIVTIVGPPKSGKTEFMYALMKNYQSYAPVPNIYMKYEFDIQVKTASSMVNIQLIDYNEQNYSNSLLEKITFESDCILCVFDLTNKKSYMQAQLQLKYIKKIKSQQLCYLIGNKSDLWDSIEIGVNDYTQSNSYEQIVQNTAYSINCQSGCVSAKLMQNIDHLVFQFTDLLINPLQSYQNVASSTNIKALQQNNVNKFIFNLFKCCKE